MSENKFKQGDVVKHKAGGETMVVDNIDNYGVNCSWRNANGHRVEGTFGEWELELVDNSQPEFFRETV